MNENNVNLSSLDLNLMTALHALLENRSVSEAAKSVGRTQSAMSHSLSRLRFHFGDPILVRDGWKMQLTPMAEQLRPRVAEANRAVQLLFDTERAFDPIKGKHHIRIATPDLCSTLFKSFIAKVINQAPHMSVAFIANVSARQAVLRGDADVGLAFGNIKPDPNLIIQPITPLEWCTFAKREHEYNLNTCREVWVHSRHIIVGQKDASPGPVEKAVRKFDISRRIVCYAPNFSTALSLAAENNMLFTTLRSPFERTAHSMGMVAIPPPFEMDPAPAALVFKADYGDAFSIWLRKLCLQILN